MIKRIKDRTKRRGSSLTARSRTSRPPRPPVPIRTASVIKKPKTFFYSAFGLGISSELEFPELSKVRSRRTQVRIRRGPVPPSSATFHWDNDSSIRVSGGRSIRIDVHPGAEMCSVRLGVLGPAFSRLLVQRGDYVVHASAVVIGGKAVAFIGASGTGKSTLAAALCRRGHRLLCDDLLRLRIEKKRVIAFPAFPRHKLWPDSLRRTGHKRRSAVRIDGHSGKYWLNAAAHFHPRPVPLKRIYLLTTSGGAGLRRVSARNGLFELLKHSAGHHSARETGLWNDFFERSRSLIERVPICVLSRGPHGTSVEKCARQIIQDAPI